MALDRLSRPPIGRRVTSRLEMLMPIARSKLTSRTIVTCPWWCCISTKRRNSGPTFLPTLAGSGVALPRPYRFGRLPPGLASAPLSMPLGLIAGRTFSPLSRAISSRCSATIRLNSATSPSSVTGRAFSSDG